MPDVMPALSKSGLLWIELADRTWPVWHVWVGQTAYVVCGTGEQPLPELPERVTLIFRSQDTCLVAGRRVARVPATAHRVLPHSPAWPEAVAALVPKRLNAPEGDLAARWAESASVWLPQPDVTVWALQPDLDAADTNAPPDQPSGAREPVPTPATTDSWHPAHRPMRQRRRRPTG